MLNLCQTGPGLFLDNAVRRRISRIVFSAALLPTVVACRAPEPRIAAPDRVPSPPAAHEPADPSYDWHGLLIAPFGSLLKDIPAALHEVLLFRDDAHGNGTAGNAATGGAAADAAAVDAECYAADAPAPRFVGRVPEEYLLCFKQDRLSRIQASVRVVVAQAPGVFAAACAGWLKNAASTTGVEAPGVGTTGVGTPGVGTLGVGTPGVGAGVGGSGVGAPGTVPPSAEAQTAGVCEGRDGAIRFRGRLEEEPGGADLPQPESVLSIVLDGAPNP
jgi:hypothetical protein